MKSIKELTTAQKLELKKLFELNLKEVERELKIEKEEKAKELTSRQLEFRRDDALPLCKKYFNKKYENYKNDILAEITKKFENSKKSKEKADKIYFIFSKFFETLNKNEVKVQAFLTENEEVHLHIKATDDNKAA